MANSTGVDISECYSCPVCFEIPESEVFECENGHWLCSTCYFQVTPALCPECRTRLDRDRPRRCRAIERVLEGIKIDCVFKSNGCTKMLARGSALGHQAECIFNFDKFGQFVNLCKSIGYPNCSFKFNNGIANEAVEHFVSKHGCIITTSEKFQMELISFKECAKAGGSGFHFWTPVIADLKEWKCYLLTMVVLNKVDASFAWFSILLRYPTNEHRENSPVEIEYTVKTSGGLQFTVWTGKPMSLNKANALVPNEIEFVNYSLPFARCCSEEGSLLIDCNIRRHEIQVPARKETVQSFVCTKNTNSFSVVDNIQRVNLGFDFNSKVLVRFNRNGSSYAAKNFRDTLKDDCKSNRNKILPSMINIFEGGKWASLRSMDVEWLKMDLLFVTTEYGSLEALKYLIGKGVNFNIVDEVGRPPLHYTMWDKDKEMGLGKAKLLVDSGVADIHVLDGDMRDVLNLASEFWSNEVVEYFLQKGCYVNAADCIGCTPLHRAVWNESQEEGLKIARTLFANGADPNIENNLGKTPLEIARNEKKTKIAKLLGSYQSNM